MRPQYQSPRECPRPNAYSVRVSAWLSAAQAAFVRRAGGPRYVRALLDLQVCYPDVPSGPRPAYRSYTWRVTPAQAAAFRAMGGSAALRACVVQGMRAELRSTRFERGPRETRS